jgi:HEAT repeat protein
VITIFISVFLNKTSSFADDLLINVLSLDDWESKLLNRISLEDLKQDENFKNLLFIANNKGINWKLRIRAIKILGFMDYKKVVPYLVDMFNDHFFHDNCPSIKSYVALALGYYKEESVINTLISGLNDKEILVREAVVNSLGKIGDKRVLPYLIKALNDKSFAVKIASLKAIERISDPSVIEHIKDFLKNIDDDILKREVEGIIEKLMRLDIKVQN